MKEKKFILFEQDTYIAAPDIPYYNQGGLIRTKEQLGNNGAVALNGLDCRTAIDFSILDLGIAFPAPSGTTIGSDITTNGLFDALLGGPGWENNDSEANNGAIFGLNDFSTKFENGVLKMRTYSGTTNAPFVSQNVTLGSDLSFRARLNFSGANNFNSTVVYYNNMIGSSFLSTDNRPFITLGGVEPTVIPNLYRVRQSGEIGNDATVNDHDFYFSASDLKAAGHQPGDTVELRLQMRKDITGTNPLELEFAFDSIELIATEDPVYAAYIDNAYSYSNCVLVSDNNNFNKFQEDIISILDASSSSGSSSNKEKSFAEVSDLGLNSNKILARQVTLY